MNTNRRFKRNCKRKQGELIMAVWMWSIVSDEGRKVNMENTETREKGNPCALHFLDCAPALRSYFAIRMPTLCIALCVCDYMVLSSILFFFSPLSSFSPFLSHFGCPLYLFTERIVIDPSIICQTAGEGERGKKANPAESSFTARSSFHTLATIASTDIHCDTARSVLFTYCPQLHTLKSTAGSPLFTTLTLSLI